MTIDFLKSRGAKELSVWYLYLLCCSDGSFYTGITSDLTSRLERHNAGRASVYTKLRRPVQLRYVEQFENKSQARRREIEIKNYSIANKKKLIEFGTGKKICS